MAAITITDLTTGTVTGSGVFDKLMEATKAHIQVEFEKNRIKGPEYATVYLGGLQAVLDRSLQFLLNQQKTDLEAQLLQAQLTTEQKNQALLDAQLAKLQAETNLVNEQIKSEIKRNELNGILDRENQVLVAQKCKLDVEFDVLTEQKLKTTAETALLQQKKLTEQGQVSAVGVDADSVIGKQKALYQAQTDGYQRNAEQKAAKILVDAWSVARTTDSTTPRDGTNHLSDANVGNVMDKLFEGVKTATTTL